MGARPFRWLPLAGSRHAIRCELVAGDVDKTLCGVPLTVPRGCSSNVQWCWPTCAACDAAWRRFEGIPLFPRQEVEGGSARRKATQVAKSGSRP